MSAAACWEDSQPNLPPEIQNILDSGSDAAIANLELLVALPEWEVELPGGERASQTDVLAITRNSSGLVILGVEAKVDETFGPTIGDKKAKHSDGQLERILFLEKTLGRNEPFDGQIRYQLLHRSVSALLTARAFHASTAVMLVHSFSRDSAWRNDFDRFCQELNCESLSPDLYEIPKIEGGRLLLGWCKGNEKYLDSELPNAL